MTDQPNRAARRRADRARLKRRVPGQGSQGVFTEHGRSMFTIDAARGRIRDYLDWERIETVTDLAKLVWPTHVGDDGPRSPSTALGCACLWTQYQTALKDVLNHTYPLTVGDDAFEPIMVVETYCTHIADQALAEHPILATHPSHAVADNVSGERIGEHPILAIITSLNTHGPTGE